MKIDNIFNKNDLKYLEEFLTYAQPIAVGLLQVEILIMVFSSSPLMYGVGYVQPSPIFPSWQWTYKELYDKQTWGPNLQSLVVSLIAPRRKKDRRLSNLPATTRHT